MATHTLLVADDSLTVQRVVALAFAGSDIEVSTVGTGADAMVRLASNPPDILLADVSLGTPDAYALADYVRRRSACAGVRVVLLAGMFQPADDARVAELGCDAVIGKPLTPGYLVSRVRELLAEPPRRTALAAPTETAPTEVASTGGGTSGGGLPSGMEAFASEAVTGDPAALRAADDYFRRLDDAFRTLESRGSAPAHDPEDQPLADEDDEDAPVPTLQALLARLPEDSRTRISSAVVSAPLPAADPDPAPAPPPQAAHESAADPLAADPLVEAITSRVIERLAADPGLMRALASRVADAAGRHDS